MHSRHNIRFSRGVVTTVKRWQQRGSTLIEIIIAATVITLVMTAIAVGLTISLRSTAESQFRLAAGAAAQEAIEVFNRERTIQGWASFRDTFPQQTNEGCMNTLDSSFNFAAYWAQPSPCGVSTFQIPGVGIDFTRQVVIEKDTTTTPPAYLTVTVTVQWIEGSATFDEVKTKQVVQTREYREY